MATRRSLEDLKGQLESLGGVGEEGAGLKNEGRVMGNGEGKGKEMGPGEIWGCRFNSKNFGVEWERSKRVVEEVGLRMVVVEWVD